MYDLGLKFYLNIQSERHTVDKLNNEFIRFYMMTNFFSFKYIFNIKAEFSSSVG